MRNNFIFLEFFITFSCGLHKKTETQQISGTYVHENEYATYTIDFLNDSILELTQNFKCNELREDIRLQKIRATYSLGRKIKYKNKKFLKIMNTDKWVEIPITVKNLTNNNFQYPYIENDDECSMFKKINRTPRRIFDGRMIYPIFQENILTNFDEGIFDYRIQFDEVFYMKTFTRDTLKVD